MNSAPPIPPPSMPFPFLFGHMFYLVNIISFAGFKGKDCSVDIDLCSFGLCGEHTLICAETRGGHDVTCTCEKGERPSVFAVASRTERSADRKVSVSHSFLIYIQKCDAGCNIFPHTERLTDPCDVFHLQGSVEGWRERVGGRGEVFVGLFNQICCVCLIYLCEPTRLPHHLRSLPTEEGPLDALPWCTVMSCSVLMNARQSQLGVK